MKTDTLEISRDQIEAVVAAIYMRLTGVDVRAVGFDLDSVLNPAGVAATMEIQGDWKVTD